MFTTSPDEDMNAYYPVASFNTYEGNFEAEIPGRFYHDKVFRWNHTLFSPNVTALKVVSKGTRYLKPFSRNNL